MIRKLLDRIIFLAEAGFGPMLTAPNSQLAIGPLSPVPTTDLPRIAFYPSLFEIGQSVRELRSSKPRPLELREEFVVDANNPQGPYSLANTPLEKSMICKLVFNQGEVSERRSLVQEGQEGDEKDYIIDYQNAVLNFSTSLAGVSHIQVSYSYVGVFTVLEFEQAFLIDLYHTDTAALSQFSTLLTAIIVTNHDELIEHFNFTDPSVFLASAYNANVLISQIDCISGTPHFLDSTPRLQLKYQVKGQLKPIKVITDGFGLIERVHSPGVVSDHPVDIDPGWG